MNGNMVDLDAFKAEVDAGAAAMREALKAQAPNPTDRRHPA